MNIIRSTAAYERWLHKQLHGDVVQKDLDEKHVRMAADAFQFLRATYWRWAETILKTCPELADAPSVLAVGDVHVENFGSWRDREGRLVWGVNDFDEAAKMPYVLDLVRLATSAVLAEVHGLSAGRNCAFILNGYAAGLDDPSPFVLDRRHEWLRREVEVPEEERRKFWDKLGPEKNAKRGNAGGGKRKPPRRYVSALESTLPGAGIQLVCWARSAGSGSLGRPRWIGYGLWRGAPVVREAKAVTQSSWTRAHHGARRPHCAEIATGNYRSPDPWYTLNGSILVRRLSPNNRKIELAGRKEDADDRELYRPPDLVNEKMLTAMGRELAAIHLGTANKKKAVKADLEARKRGWLLSAAKRAADRIRDEQVEWKTALRRATGATPKRRRR
jgi:hypothetical protein